MTTPTDKTTNGLPPTPVAIRVAEPEGRRIRLLGELRRSEVRVVRGGMAIWTLML